MITKKDFQDLKGTTVVDVDWVTSTLYLSNGSELCFSLHEGYLISEDKKDRCLPKPVDSLETLETLIGQPLFYVDSHVKTWVLLSSIGEPNTINSCIFVKSLEYNAYGDKLSYLYVKDFNKKFQLFTTKPYNID